MVLGARILGTAQDALGAVDTLDMAQIPERLCIYHLSQFHACGPYS
jgi:hypothetical protein